MLKPVFHPPVLDLSHGFGFRPCKLCNSPRPDTHPTRPAPSSWDWQDTWPARSRANQVTTSHAPSTGHPASTNRHWVLKTQAQEIGRGKRRGNSSTAILGRRHPDKTTSQKGCRDSETVSNLPEVYRTKWRICQSSRYFKVHPLSPIRLPCRGFFYLPLGCLRATKRQEDTQALSCIPEEDEPFLPQQHLPANFRMQSLVESQQVSKTMMMSCAFLLNAGIQACVPHRLYLALCPLAASTGSETEMNHSGFSAHEQRSPQKGPSSSQRLPLFPTTPRGSWTGAEVAPGRETGQGHNTWPRTSKHSSFLVTSQKLVLLLPQNPSSA